MERRIKMHDLNLGLAKEPFGIVKDRDTVRAEAVAELESENKRLREALECIASFSYTASSIGGDDRINKLREIARAALGKE
jgi:hypothetical protein